MYSYEDRVLAYDLGPRTVYVACEAAVVSILSVEAPRVRKAGAGRVGANAHVVGVDPDTHRLWFPLKDVDGHPVLRIVAPR